MTSVVMLECVTYFKIRLSKSKYNDIIDPKQGFQNVKIILNDLQKLQTNVLVKQSASFVKK